MEVCSAGPATMTMHDFGEHGSALIHQLLAYGFARPIAWAAMTCDGLTTTGSSEPITGPVRSEVKTTAPPGAFACDLLPIHILFVEVQGHVAYGVIDQSGTASVRLLP
jgi:hypothetical protein